MIGKILQKIILKNITPLIDVIDKGGHNQSIADKMPNLWWIKANDFI